jgi:hypothetical protein
VRWKPFGPFSFEKSWLNCCASQHSAYASKRLSLCVSTRELVYWITISLMSTSRLLQVLLLPMEEEKNEQSRLFLFWFISDEFSCPYRSSHHKNWQFKEEK